LNHFNDFLASNNWFYQKYAMRDQGKLVSFQIALNLFLQRGGETIIESGCVRFAEDFGAGNSTTLLGDFCKHYNKKLITVDNSYENLERAKFITREFKEVITYIESDSVSFLSRCADIPDLLYLDSMDFPLEGPSEEACQIHQLNELKAIYDRLPEKAVILLDDNDLPFNGKTKLSNQFLRDKGWTVIYSGKQICWAR